MPRRFAHLGEAGFLDLVRRAIEANRIDIHLQPIVTLPQRRIRYYEALTRLRTSLAFRSMSAHGRERLDRVMLGPGSAEHHLVPDRTRPMDFEVYSVETVQGFGSGREAQRDFKPLYATQHGRSDNAQGEFYLTDIVAMAVAWPGP